MIKPKVIDHNQLQLNEDLTDMKTIGECLAVIAELHPNWKYNKNLTPKLWFDALKTYPKNTVKRSVLNVAQKSQFTPKLADVLEDIEKTNKKSNFELEDYSLSELDDWWLSLNENERNDVIKKTEDYLNNENVILNNYELERANIIKEIERELND